MFSIIINSEEPLILIQIKKLLITAWFTTKNVEVYPAEVAKEVEGG